MCVYISFNKFYIVQQTVQQQPAKNLAKIRKLNRIFFGQNGTEDLKSFAAKRANSFFLHISTTSRLIFW